jgi:site-specific DNA recombinase
MRGKPKNNRMRDGGNRHSAPGVPATMHRRIAAVYARVSTNLQNPLSTKDQIEKCREFARTNGLTVDEALIYVDEAISGVGSNRPALMALLQAAYSPKRSFDVILTEDLSRISRSTAESLTIFNRLRFAGVEVFSIAQGFSSADEQSELFWTFHGLKDSYYVRDLGKKTHRGMAANITRGLHAGGRCFGYRLLPAADGNGRRPVVNEAEAAIVRRIFEMSLAGVSYKKIAGQLNREGIPSPRPRRTDAPHTWCPTAIREMLHRDLYAGRLIWNRSQFVKEPGTNRRVCRPRPKTEWLIVEHPELCIVSDQLWKSVQARLLRMKEIYGNCDRPGLMTRAASSRYLLSGLLKCGLCGGNLTIVHRQRFGCPQHHVRGACSNGLTERAEVLETQFLAGIQADVLRPEVVECVVEEFRSQLAAVEKAHPNEAQHQTARKVQLEGELKNLVAAIAKSGYSQSLLDGIAAKEAELRTIAAQPARKPISAMVDDVREYVTRGLRDLRGLLNSSVELARAELARHVGTIRMMPIIVGKIGVYEASGSWNLLTGVGISGAVSDGCGGVQCTEAICCSVQH